MVRIRLWNDPYDESGNSYGGGTNDLDKVMSLARRVVDAGMEWMLCLHYSDFWTDPGKQITPKAWQGLDVEGLALAVYDFTRGTLEKLKVEGVAPAMVAVGNEITAGLLWPLGKAPQFDNIARFINVGIQAVKETLPDAEIMLHLDCGGNNDACRQWFDRYLAAGGRDFDVIGLSYYPTWHGPLSGLQANLNDLAQRYQKDVMVVELGMPFSFADYYSYEGLTQEESRGMAAKASMRDRLEYPATPEGQAAFLREVLSFTRQIPAGRGRGVVWWEPAWLPVPGCGWAEQPGWEYVKEKGPGGNEWANQALFDYEGNVLPALQVIRDFE